MEEAQIEQWTAFNTSTLTPQVRKIAGHYWGWNVDNDGIKKAESELKGSAKILNNALAGRAWLVGERLTLADIVAFNILITAFTFSFDAGVCKAFPNLAAWFAKMAKLPIVARTAGYIKMKGGAPAPAAAAPAAGGKKEKAKQGKQDKKAVEKKEEKAAEKDDDDFDPFADDGEDEKPAAPIKAKVKAKKPPPIAKSLVVLEVKPWGPETDLDVLGKKICDEIVMDGLVWKTEFKKEPVAFGVFKIVIGCVIEDDKVPMDDL